MENEYHLDMFFGTLAILHVASCSNTPPPQPPPYSLRHTPRLIGQLIQTVCRLTLRHTHTHLTSPSGLCTPLAGQPAVLQLVDGLSCSSSLL